MKSLAVFCIAQFIALSTTHAATLLDIYELALQQDAQLGEARADYREGREAYARGRAALLPELAVTGTHTESDFDQEGVTVLGNNATFTISGAVDSTNDTYQVSLAQPLFNLPNWFLFQQGRALTGQVAAQFAEEQQDLIIRVTDAYFEVLRAWESRETARAEEKAIARQLEQAQARFEVGLVPITDKYEAQAAYDAARVNTLEAGVALDIAFESLEVLTGESFQQLAGLGGHFNAETPQPLNREAWVEFALDNNYGLKADTLARDAAKQLAAAKKAEHLPKLSGRLSYLDMEVDGDQFGSAFSNAQDGTTVSLELRMPIFTGGLTSSERRRANEQYVQAEKRLLATRRNVVREARSQYLQVTTDAARIDARKQAVVSAESALEATRSGYKVGTRNIVDLLQAERTLYQARRDYANARFDFIASSLALKKVAGQLGPEDINRLNGWLDSSAAVDKGT